MSSNPENSRAIAYKRGPHWIALCATALTWPLLLVGGSVTVYRVGMAVPDWPTTFGINMFVYNFWNAPWGVYLEHTHRLFGSAVGVACIIMAVWFALADRRLWMKLLGGFSLLAVIGQGVMGGLRVNWNSPLLAFIHGCTAELFFGLMVALCVLTGRSWMSSAPDQTLTDSSHLRRRGLVTLTMIFAQIVLGAWLRHFSSSGMLIIHAFFATTVIAHTIMLWIRVERLKSTASELLASARVMAFAVTGQLVLGITAWLILRPFDGVARHVSSPQALVRISHQGLGAVLFGASVVLTLRTYRLFRQAPKLTRDATTQGSAGRLEVIA
jgi:cytochrome c oxidase assembly protein subunit 15